MVMMHSHIGLGSRRVHFLFPLRLIVARLLALVKQHRQMGTQFCGAI